MIWNPISQTPEGCCACSALILCVDAGDQYLLPGPATWFADNARWENNKGVAIQFDPHAEYYWASEADIIEQAIREIVIVGAGEAASSQEVHHVVS